MISRSDLTLLIKYKYVKEFYFCVIFLAKKFLFSMIIRSLEPSVSTKPLNDAQMRGAFLYIYTFTLKIR